MDQIKIGKFIQELRKQKNLTQITLAEKLGITDKAISKWERGIAMPDTSIMLELCEILGVSVNELLSGERIDINSENQKNERLIIEMAKELERKNKVIWSTMWVIMIVSMVALVAGIFASAFFVPKGVWQLVSIISICIIFSTICFFAVKLEVSVGAYKCKNCGFEIVPTYKQTLNSMHKGTTRYLKCPKCNKRTWCKKIVK